MMVMRYINILKKSKRGKSKSKIESNFWKKIKSQKIIIKYFCFFNDFDELMNYLNYIENNIIMMEENKILF
jgi:hypothetical protein